MDADLLTSSVLSGSGFASITVDHDLTATSEIAHSVKLVALYDADGDVTYYQNGNALISAAQSDEYRSEYGQPLNR